MKRKNENTRNDKLLKTLQQYPFPIKCGMSRDRIRQWYNDFGGNVYIGNSGGKDSGVLQHMVNELYPEVISVYNDTGLEYSSVRAHALSNENVIALKPKMDFLQVILKYGYPIVGKEVSQTIYEARKSDGKKYKYRLDKLNGTYKTKNGEKSPYNMEKWKFLLDAPFRISHECCHIMKKEPSVRYEKESGNVGFIGTTTDESRLRRQKWIKYGCNAYEAKRKISSPLSFWTNDDILFYTHIHHLDLAACYGDIIPVNIKSGYEDTVWDAWYDDSMDVYSRSEAVLNHCHLTTTGCLRTGCVFCMFGITQDKDRFLKLKKEEPELYNYVMNGGKFDEEGMWIPYRGLGYKFIIDYLNENGDLGILY